MRNSLLLLSIIALTLGTSLQGCGPTTEVVKLTAANFNQLVINSNDLWFVEFFGTLFLTSFT
jgi:hypothetical protein